MRGECVHVWQRRDRLRNEGACVRIHAALSFRRPLMPPLPFALPLRTWLSESCSSSAGIHSNGNEVYLIFLSLQMTRSVANDSISLAWLAIWRNCPRVSEWRHFWNVNQVNESNQCQIVCITVKFCPDLWAGLCWLVTVDDNKGFSLC